MNTANQVISQFSPMAQLALVLCLFAFLCIVFMAIFMLIVDREKMHTAIKGATKATKALAQFRRGRFPKDLSNESTD